MASSNFTSNQTPKVRIIAKIRGFDHESKSSNGSSTPWISVRRHDEDGQTEKVTISFGDQSAGRKNAYDMDYCYEQNEDLGMIFSREVKPLVSGVLDGQNATVVAYGARGSGKTYTIQGSEEKPGLATLAMTEILSTTEETGKSITVSLYEVYQDHVYDLLGSNYPEVQVFENAPGKIELKGLSQVPITSISEFHKLYYSGGSGYRKPADKIGLKVSRRSHKGLTIRILSNCKHGGKMNFVDLAGYEDARRNSIDCTNLGESAKINKSLYALLNVVYAVNANESRVPYRESKLTRVLQDSIGGPNRVLMLTCLNSSYCQDTIYTASLAARSFQGINGGTDSIKRGSKSSNKIMEMPSTKNRKPVPVSSTKKKEISSQVRLHEMKSSDIKNGRKLFDDGIPSTTPKQAKLPLKCASVMVLPDSSLFVESSLQKEKNSTSDVIFTNAESTSTLEKETSMTPAFKALEGSLPDKVLSPQIENNHFEAITVLDTDTKTSIPFEKEGDFSEKENKNSQSIEGKSPPLSERLRELSNNLKSLCSSTPSAVMDPSFLNTDYIEPKTPVIEQSLRASDKWELARFQSSREIFNSHNSGMKQSLVENCLQFLNSATKEELKELKGIGDKRATYIIELREKSPEPFKNIEDLQDIGLSAKQVKGMMKSVAAELFD